MTPTPRRSAKTHPSAAAPTAPTPIDLYLLAMSSLFKPLDQIEPRERPVSCAPDRHCEQRPSRFSSS